MQTELAQVLAAAEPALAPVVSSGAGIKEWIALGAAIGLGGTVLLWALLTRQRPVPGHARDGAEKLARELIDELESRAERLEALLEGADRRINELRSLEQRAEQARRAALRTSENVASRETTSSPAREAAHHATHHGGQSQGLPSLHRDVLDLARTGLNSIEIARRLSVPTGQVELIMNLHAVRPAAHADSARTSSIS